MRLHDRRDAPAPLNLPHVRVNLVFGGPPAVEISAHGYNSVFFSTLNPPAP